MNLRCSYCSTPFALGMAEKVGALRLMHEQNLHHYDAYCPRCRRANPVSRQRLEMFTPGWQTAMTAPQPTLPGFAAPPPRPAQPVPAAPKAASTRRKHAPASKRKTTAKKPAAKSKPASKPRASAAKRKPSKKGAARKASSKKK